MNETYHTYLEAQINTIDINQNSTIILQIPVQFHHLSPFTLELLYSKCPKIVHYIACDLDAQKSQIENFKTFVSQSQQLSLLQQTDIDNLIYIKIETGILELGSPSQAISYTQAVFAHLQSLELDISPRFTFKKIRLFHDQDAIFLNTPLTTLNKLFENYVKTLKISQNSSRNQLIKRFYRLDFLSKKTFLSASVDDISSLSGTIFASEPVFICGIKFIDFWAQISDGVISQVGAGENQELLKEILFGNQELKKVSKVVLSGKEGFQLDSEALYYLANNRYGVQIVFGIENELACEFLKFNVPFGGDDLQVVGIPREGNQEVIYEGGEFVGLFK